MCVCHVKYKLAKSSRVLRIVFLFIHFWLHRHFANAEKMQCKRKLHKRKEKQKKSQSLLPIYMYLHVCCCLLLLQHIVYQVNNQNVFRNFSIRTRIVWLLCIESTILQRLQLQNRTAPKNWCTANMNDNWYCVCV